MAKNGPKIKELAHELGVTARQLIDRCRSEGVSAQNSLTRIEPALVPRIKAWFTDDAETDDAEKP